MSIFRKSSEERYEDYCNETNMFARMDYQEWERIEERAHEIASGLVLGTFERDEKVWQRVREIKGED